MKKELLELNSSFFHGWGSLSEMDCSASYRLELVLFFFECPTKPTTLHPLGEITVAANVKECQLLHLFTRKKNDVTKVDANLDNMIDKTTRTTGEERKKEALALLLKTVGLNLMKYTMLNT